VEGGSQEDLIKFYSSYYRTLTSPTIFNENDGSYLGFDNKIHKLDASQSFFLTDMSIWDTHRTQFPWLTLIRPDISLDIVKSLILMYQQGGDLPRWPLANGFFLENFYEFYNALLGYTNCMIGTHAIIVIADAYFKGELTNISPKEYSITIGILGLKSFDIKTAYEGMKQSATQSQANAGRSDIQDWIKLGYIPYDKSMRGCSETMEYACKYRLSLNFSTKVRDLLANIVSILLDDDWALGNFAASLGFTEDAQLFLNRSKNYKVS
jgi:putative alpha-1,2-mannosidase